MTTQIFDKTADICWGQIQFFSIFLRQHTSENQFYHSMYLLFATVYICPYLFTVVGSNELLELKRRKKVSLSIQRFHGYAKTIFLVKCDFCTRHVSKKIRLILSDLVKNKVVPIINTKKNTLPLSSRGTICLSHIPHRFASYLVPLYYYNIRCSNYKILIVFHASCEPVKLIMFNY